MDRELLELGKRLNEGPTGSQVEPLQTPDSLTLTAHTRDSQWTIAPEEELWRKEERQCHMI